MASEERQEKVEDILREWRDMVCYHDGPVHPLNHGAVMLNLDRIEAAHKRELGEVEAAAKSLISDAVMSGKIAVVHEQGNASPTTEKSSAVGNAAEEGVGK